MNLKLLQKHSNLISHWRSLPQIHHLKQVTPLVDIYHPTHTEFHQRSLLEEIPQAGQKPLNLTFHQRSLYKLHHLRQVTLSVGIPQAYRIQPNLIRYWRSLFYLQLLIPVFDKSGSLHFNITIPFR